MIFFNVISMDIIPMGYYILSYHIHLKDKNTLKGNKEK